MKIKMSRHAKRRAKLYKIPEETINSVLSERELSEGENEIIQNISGFKYPLKIIIKVQDDLVTVISTYPFKKGKSK